MQRLATHTNSRLILRVASSAYVLRHPDLWKSTCAYPNENPYQGLLPESQLLLALIPGPARETQATVGLRHLATFRGWPERLASGKPLRYGGLAVFPLVWPETDTSPYALLSRAIENGTATVEEVSQSGSAPNVVAGQ